MIGWIDTIIQGVLLGGLYALFAIGLSLIFGIMRLVNLAHGDLIVLAAFVILAVMTALGINVFVAALFALVIMSVWRWMGYYAVIILAGLQGVPRELYEAATIDGANRRQLFTRITVPMISSTLFFVLIISIMWSLAVFEQMYVMTSGGPQDATISISMYLYQQGFQFFRMGYASAIAWVIFFLTFLVTALNWAFRKRWVHEG